MRQIVLLASGDIVVFDRIKQTVELYERDEWFNAHKLLNSRQLVGLPPTPIVGQTLQVRYQGGSFRSAIVVKWAWELKGMSLEESLYNEEWIQGYETWVHKRFKAQNPYAPGCSNHLWWNTGFNKGVETHG